MGERERERKREGDTFIGDGMILNKCGIKGEKISEKHRQTVKGEALSAPGD